jgi:DNA-binding transcriptional ArsR family regulator
MSERRRVTATIATRLLCKLIDGPISREQLAESVGLSLPTASAWLKSLQNASLVHVCRWDPDTRGYPTVAMFAWAPGAGNVPRPTRTQAEQKAAWRAAKKGAVTA